MKNLLELIKALYGPKAISSTIGTRTNVIRLPSGKLQKYLSKDLNIEAASDNAAVNAYNEMRELIPEVAKMNDAERLIFEGNLRRLRNKLEDSGLIQKENVSSGITSLQSKVEELKQAGKELEKVTGEKATLTDVLKDIGASQQSMSRMYDEGLVRATARQILINDIKAGKIKNITVSEAINMKEPIDPFRQIYGEGALEQLDSLIPNLRGLKTEMEAEKLARSKFKFEPDENRLPGSVSIEEGRKAEQEFGINKPAKVSDFKAEVTKRTSIDDLIDEYNANQDRLRLSDEEGGTAISYEEFKKIQKRNEDIAKALEDKGISSKVEEKPEAEIIPFRKKPTEPEGKADGGRIGYAYGTPAMGLDYLTGMEPSKGYADGGRIGFQRGTIPKILEFLIEKLSSEKGFDKGLLQRAKPKAVQDLYIEKFGSLPSAEEIASLVNKQLKSKSSMEVINPKTGEVTSPVEPVQTAERKPIYYDVRDEFDKLKSKHKNAAAAHDELININIYDKIAPDQLAEVMADMKGKDFSSLSQKQQMEYYKKAQNYIDDLRRIDRTSQAVEKHNSGKELGMIDKRYLDKINPVDLSDITQPQYTIVGGKKVLDATHPDTIQSFSEFAQAIDPEGYREFSKRVDRINELSTMKKNQKRFEQYGLEDYKKLNSTRINELLNDIKNPPSFLEEERNIVTNAAGKGLKNYEDIQFKVDKETLQKHLEDLLQQKQIEEAQVELGQLKETNRKPNASGGLNYLMGL